MNKLTLRGCVALACITSLVACGGSGGTLVLGGSISGLTKDGLVLQNNGGSDLTVLSGTSAFSFTDLIGNDTSYNVTVKTNPAGATCTVFDGKGKTVGYNVTNIGVICINAPRTLGGQISGLNATGLVLINGADRYTAAKPGDTTFTMPATVPDGSNYGVTVLTQPANQVCTVSNGTGTAGATNVTSVLVSCI